MHKGGEDGIDYLSVPRFGIGMAVGFDAGQGCVAGLRKVKLVPGFAAATEWRHTSVVSCRRRS